MDSALSCVDGAKSAYVLAYVPLTEYTAEDNLRKQLCALLQQQKSECITLEKERYSERLRSPANTVELEIADTTSFIGQRTIFPRIQGKKYVVQKWMNITEIIGGDSPACVLREYKKTQLFKELNDL